jgi:hypothetical protein
MKRKSLTMSLMLTLLFIGLVGTTVVNFGKANPTLYKYTALPIISVYSPTNTTSFNVNEVLLNFSITRPREWEMTMSAQDWTISQYLKSVSVHVDSELCESISVSSNLSSAPFTYFVYLKNLTDGEHNITIHAYASAFEYAQWYSKPMSYTISNSSIVHFTVDTTPPTITVFELENKEHPEFGVLLNFTVNEPVSRISYVLDGQENITIAGNCTITNLLYGEHNITVFATDEVGNTGASQTIDFTLTKEAEPFPTALVATAFGASAAIIGIGLLVYFKKRKH